MSTVSEPMVARPRSATRLVLPPVPSAGPRGRAHSWFRLSWLLGLGLLTASLVGASHVLHSRQTEPQPPSKAVPDRPAANSPGVICHGTVAIDGVPPDGVGLAPAQAGEVTELLAYDGQRVRAGDILLRVNDAPFQTAVAQADLGVRLAELQVAEARRGLDLHRYGLEAQRAAINATRHKLREAEFKLHRERSLQEISQSNNDLVAAAEEALKAAKSGVEAEEAKLRAMEAGRPDIELEKAERNVDLAKERLQQARTALDNCVLKVRTDGTILRIATVKGALISGQTRPAPILFAPAGPRVVRAEVPQEFAHRVQAGMTAVIQDEANVGFVWQGKVTRLADAYLPRRAAGTDVLSLGGNEAWGLECVVELEPSSAPPRLNQRVRVSIGTQRTP